MLHASSAKKIKDLSRYVFAGYFKMETTIKLMHQVKAQNRTRQVDYRKSNKEINNNLFSVLQVQLHSINTFYLKIV